MEGGAKFLKKNTKKQLKHLKHALRSLRQKHVKTASAKLRKQQQIKQTMKKIDRLRGKNATRRRSTLRRRRALATAISTPSTSTNTSRVTQKYASSRIVPIVSPHLSPSSNLTTSLPSPPAPIEPSENLSFSPISANSSVMSVSDVTPNLSPVPSSIGTDTSVTPASPMGAVAAVFPNNNANISPITVETNDNSQGSLHLSDLDVSPQPNNTTASPATTIDTNSM
jgi:hypothetical protein